MIQFSPRLSCPTDCLSLPVCITPVHFLNGFILTDLTDQSIVCFYLLLTLSYPDISNSKACMMKTASGSRSCVPKFVPSHLMKGI